MYIVNYIQGNNTWNCRKKDMGFMDMFNPNTIMEAATGVANQMIAATTSLVDKLMSSVLLG